MMDTLSNENHRLEQLASFTEWNPSPVIELNLEGKIVYLNLAARARFPGIINKQTDHPLIMNIVNQVIKMIEDHSNIIVYAREVSFSDYIYEQHIFCIPGKNSIFIYMNDVTAKKRAEEQIKKFNQELEERVVQRTAQLERINEDLRLAKEMAEQADRAKGVFLATMSHEVRTPLNGVIGMTNLLLDTNLTEEQKQYLNAIHVSGESLLMLLTDILDFTKIESGKIELEKIKFELKTLVDEVIDIHTDQIKKKKLTVNSTFDPAVPNELIGDFGRIQQILNNLISNAIKFTEAGTITLSVTLQDRKGNKVLVQFEVADTGIGIAAEIRPRLFLPFSQGDSSTTRKYGGAGLGLAICKRLTQILDGTISFESELGKGSQFIVILPLIDGREKDKKLDNVH